MRIFLISLLFNLFLHASNMQELLYNGNCITCHHHTKSISAPSIREIKDHYIQVFPLEKDFVNYMSTWVLKPNSKTSIMLHSIKKYGLMPELGYDYSTLEEISHYIYTTEF